MCRFYEVPAREESRRYLVLHSGSGLPDGAELLGPFSRALEKVRVDGVDRNVGLWQGASSEWTCILGPQVFFILYLEGVR